MKLEVGNVLYRNGSRYEVTRVTPKRAFIRVNDRYEVMIPRDSQWGSFRQIGASVWDRPYEAETPELIEQYRRSELIYRIQRAKITALSTEKLEKIVEIMGEI
jgi:hypothetical protein